MDKVFKHNLPRLNFRYGHLIEIFYAVLIPFSLGWAVFTFLRRKYYPRNKVFHSTLPVISVGNIHSGGSGKTPIVQILADYYKARSPAVVSRGYKASLSAMGAKVNLQGPYAVGDEPWMLHKLFGLSVWIGRDRVKSIKKIEAAQVSKLVILDDGFQHLKVHRDLDLVLIDANRFPTESFCLPLGDLREPFTALNQVSAVLLTSKDTTKFEVWKSRLNEDFPKLQIFEARLKVDGLYYGEVPYSEFRMKKLLAFSGIANNQRFNETISYLPNAKYFKGYRDHHSYSVEDVNEIISQGKELEVEGYVTTDKDWIKVSRYFNDNDEVVLSLRVGYELSTEFWTFIDQRLEEKC